MKSCNHRLWEFATRDQVLLKRSAVLKKKIEGEVVQIDGSRKDGKEKERRWKWATGALGTFRSSKIT